VDVVMVQGYGFPRWEGGPVHWAKQQDRAQLLKDLEQQVSAAGFGSAMGDVEKLLGA
jgi:3-hydroxyacyl-CoA dehydrogenase